jgi:chloramphenicol 3-O phosphotransferase
MEKGKIIFLNGVSGVGKTTLAAALQEKSEEIFFAFGADTFVFMCPKKYINYEPESGAVIYKAVSIMPQTVKLFSDMGYNIIIDHVLSEHGAYEFIKPLHDYPVLFVHVICPVEELRRREIERGDRKIGQAEEQLSTLYPQNTYDLTVDTFHNSTEECADKIMALIDYPEKFTAFKTLWAKKDFLKKDCN